MTFDAARLETMQFVTREGVAHVRFSPPAGVPLVNPGFASDLLAVVEAVASDDEIRAVSVTSDDRVFCGGGDLDYFQAQADLPAAAAELVETFHRALILMNATNKPFVAGVRGTAGGAGLSIVGAFDLVVSARSAKYTLAYTKVGLTPDGTASYFIARHIGLRRMLDLTLLNRMLDAEEAERWGLVNRVVEDAEVEAVTAELAQSLADGPAQALGAAKRVVYNGFDVSLEEAGAFEASTIVAAMDTPDAVEGIAAFVERRPPSFRGR